MRCVYCAKKIIGAKKWHLLLGLCAVCDCAVGAMRWIPELTLNDRRLRKKYRDILAASAHVKRCRYCGDAIDPEGKHGKRPDGEHFHLKCLAKHEPGGRLRIAQMQEFADQMFAERDTRVRHQIHNFVQFGPVRPIESTT